MLQVPSLTLLLLGMACLCSGNTSFAEDNETGTPVRIGTYDSRAIAIAYAGSRFNPVKEKMAEFEQARAAGDQDKMKELQQWGEQLQRKLHFQGFGRVPVDDLLEPVKEGISQLITSQNVVAITSHCNATSKSVELVDLTDGLVALFEPSEKTLERVKGIRKVEPVPLTQLADMPADD